MDRQEALEYVANEAAAGHNSDQQIVVLLAGLPEIVYLAAGIDGRIGDIAKTMQEIAASQSYRKVTLKQKHAIASALVERHGSADAVVNAAFDLSDAADAAERQAAADKRNAVAYVAIEDGGCFWTRGKDADRNEENPQLIIVDAAELNRLLPITKAVKEWCKANGYKFRRFRHENP